MHALDTVYTWQSSYSQPSTDHVRETVLFHSLVGEKAQAEGGEGGETGPHSFQRKEVFGGPGSKVFSATAFQSMRNLLLGCLSHHIPSAFTAL